MAVLAIVFDSSSGQLKAQKIGSGQIANQAILSAHIGANVIATPHIANQGILSASIAPQIDVGHLYTPPFTSGYVIIGQGSGVIPVYDLPPAGTPGDNTITSAKIASGQVGDGHIYDAAIISGKIASGIVGIPHLQPWSSGKVLVGQGATTIPIIADQQGAIAFVIDGAGTAITSGGKGHIEVPFPATLNRVTLACNQSGNINLDIYKGTYATFPPTASICSGAWPHTSGNIKYQDSILSNWIKSIASGDILAFVVKGAASSIQRCTVSLGAYK